jgi:hypothetical protein
VLFVQRPSTHVSTDVIAPARQRDEPAVHSGGGAVSAGAVGDAVSSAEPVSVAVSVVGDPESVDGDASGVVFGAALSRQAVSDFIGPEHEAALYSPPTHDLSRAFARHSTTAFCAHLQALVVSALRVSHVSMQYSALPPPQLSIAAEQARTHARSSVLAYSRVGAAQAAKHETEVTTVIAVSQFFMINLPQLREG